MEKPGTDPPAGALSAQQGNREIIPTQPSPSPPAHRRNIQKSNPRPREYSGIFQEVKEKFLALSQRDKQNIYPHDFCS
jgi:hypothetical protein